MASNLQGYQNGRIQYWDEDGWAHHFLSVAAGEMVRHGVHMKVMSPDPLGMVSYLFLDLRDDRRKHLTSADQLIMNEILSYRGTVNLRFRPSSRPANDP